MTYIVTYVRQGLGNKVYALLDALFVFLRNKKAHGLRKLYIATSLSHHEGARQHEMLNNLFPHLEESIPEIEFIGWKQYDALQSGITSLPTSHAVKNVDQLQFPLHMVYNFAMHVSVPGIAFVLAHVPARTFWVNPLYRRSDIDYSHGTCLHIRYGDKLTLQHKYVIRSPKWYEEQVKKAAPSGPLYVFTDDAPTVRKNFPSWISDCIVSATPSEVFYACTFLPSIITTDSTLVVAAACLHRRKNPYVVYTPVIRWSAQLRDAWAPFLPRVRNGLAYIPFGLPGFHEEM
jgi:hypothetical protein